MPSSDYASAVGGGLKLKGVKNGGVEKKKKQKKAKAEAESSVAHDGGEDKGNSSAVQKALAEEDDEDHDNDSQLQTLNQENTQEREGRDFGKTEAQRRHEERRRKRVSEPSTPFHCSMMGHLPHQACRA